MLEDKTKEIYENKFISSCDNHGDATTIDEDNFYLQHVIMKKMQYKQQPILRVRRQNKRSIRK